MAFRPSIVHSVDEPALIPVSDFNDGCSPYDLIMSHDLDPAV